ncbi:MAG: amino acid adenylation domain-containing protein [Gammaproteobacteria bacterium]|nr:amino acid adenylation domain-containing protein [Gammaproteobacteria bacterium]
MPEERNMSGIAIVGMAVRTPGGVADLESFWQMLIEGRDCITHFKDDEIDPLVPEEVRRDPHFVAAHGILEDAEDFDAGLFGMSANQARLLDPQQRVFLQLCWHAFEHAGMDPFRSDAKIGVYAANANNTWLQVLRQTMPELIERNGEFAAMLANEKDYIATRVAHQFNLKGPAIGVYTACSSSLVAIAQAWYALMNYQCDAALAGGAFVGFPQASGYIGVSGGMESPDGSCRPFDANAGGTVFSCGAGCVVLKRLEDALEAGDTIHAVIRGVGVNNDGAEKASFTAPNPAGQAAVIRMALAQAGVPAASIGYIEAHGTGTTLGDPIEVAALRDAFALDGKPANCVLGSVKGNIGHLIAAAGVVGLIKAVLCLEHGQIPPTVHFRKPNPRINLDATPFRVAGETCDWPRGDTPRRAGVSSFGVGGTNAHVVLEEGLPQRASATRRNQHILPLSAKGQEELESLAQRMADKLAEPASEPLADVAWTLAQGRQLLPLRCTVVARDAQDAARQLLKPLRTGKAFPAPQRIWRTSDDGLSSRIYPSGPRRIWLFPGQGSQYPGMAKALWREEPDFRQALEPLLDVADSIDADLRALLLDADPNDDEAALLLAQTKRSQPALFLMSYAMARTLEAYGIEPDAMIGHSIGEYVAACLARVFDPEQALKLVARRGALMQAQPPGDMVAVQATVEDLRPHLTEGIDIACYNAESLQVISGAHEAMQAQLAELNRLELRAIPLQVSHAFHSPLMEGALPAFAEAVAAARPVPPERDFYACPDGKPISAGQATDPAYWAGQIRQPVRFADSLRHELSGDGSSLLMEVGPGHALSTLARAARGGDGETPRAVICFGAAADGKDGDGAEALARALGETWSQGSKVDLGHRYDGEKRRQVALPGYPFRRDYYGYRRRAAPEREAASAIETQTGSASHGNEDAGPAAAIVALMAEVSGEPAESIDPQQNFVALGLDSLLLTQFSLELEKRFGFKLRFRRLMQDLNTPEKLGEYIRSELPTANKSARASPASATDPQEPPTATADPTDPRTPEPPAQPQIDPLATDPAHSAGFGASARISLEHGAELEPGQRRWLDDFVARYTHRTRASRNFSRRHRQVMADPRVVTGFDPRFKEMVYPIVVERSQGARLWDLDGNEYLDLLNGFGSNFLGYQPPFITDALKAQIDAGYEIGPQHPLAAEVSELIADFTGLPRVAFCNTGSEAVMGAMRIARTVTGRDTIAMFRDSYHGIFDEAVVRSTPSFEPRPAAPGITRSSVEHMLVLDYGSDEALEILRRRSGELAAIMIEPIQARHPELRPKAFVEALREIADRAGCALIFDEVITGFRIEPGGAQAYFGVKADIGTYGKIIGGGLPFAAIAGQGRWMDALDGGDWRFGDDSQPEAGVTYFAGTFVRHPLALAAARASLKHLEQAGPELQRSLNERAAKLTERLNRHFRERRAPIEAVSFSSIWRLRVDADQEQASLLFYLLRHRGLHLYEQFGCFLSTAHGEAEVAEIAGRIEQAVDELLDAGLLRPRREQVEAQPSPATATPQDPTSEPAEEPVAAESGDSAGAPMTAGQLEKWVICQHGEKAALSYNEGVLLHLDGKLDRQALHAAIGEVWLRHEALHLAIDSERECQKIGDCSLPFEEVDLANRDGDSNGQLSERLTAWSREQMTTPFDLAAAPLVRIHLLRLGEQMHALHVVGHHLVLDGWSLTVLIRELAICYNAHREGREPELPPADSFLAYARNEIIRRRNSSAELDYWQSELADAPEALALGRADGGDAPLSFAADTLQQDLPAGSRAAVRQRAGKDSVSPFSVLLSAFSILLWRLSGKQDLVLCIPFAGQAMVGANNLVGDGVNTLPLRVRIDPSRRLSQLLEQVHTQLLDAADHQDTTLLSIARRLHEQHRRGGEPLSRIIFNLNPRIAPPDFDGLDASVRECRRGYCAWDLFFNLYDTGSELTLDLHYDTSRFDPHRLEDWIAAYGRLLDDISGDADPVLRDLASAVDPAAPPSNRKSIVTNGSGPRALPGKSKHAENPMTKMPDSDAWPDVLELIERQVRKRPDKTAVIAAGRTLSYAELWRRSGELARHLAARGVAAGERVGICVPRDEQMPLALLAVLRSGGAYVPLDPDVPDARLAWMIEDAGLRHILLGREMIVPDAVSGSKAQLHATDEKPVEPDAPDLPAPSPDALAYVIYTSGSTGKPKGVRLLHRNLGSFLAAMQREPGMRADDTLCAVTTMSFDIAGLEMYLPLVSGASVVIAGHDDILDPEKLLQLIAEHEVSVLQTTPSLLRLLLAADHSRSLRGLRLLIGGEPLPLNVARRAGACAGELWNMYGPTETTIWSSVCRIPPKPTRIAIGKPIAGTSVYVLDAERQPVAAGMEGEIWIGGPGVGDGYQGRAELTAECFQPDPFAGHGTMYRTGDLGRLEGSLLYYHGRNDHQLKLRGHRIEPGEIEARLVEHPAVREAAVLARGKDANERLVACIVADASPKLADDLRKHLREHLPEYMVPASYVRMDRFPLSPSGKLDRRALPEPDDLHTAGEHVAPRTASEALVVAAFNKVLKRSDVGVFDDFFDLGGHSLMAARLIANLRGSAKVDLPLRNLFEQPTPEKLASAIDALAWAAGKRERPTLGEQGNIEEIEL